MPRPTDLTLLHPHRRLVVVGTGGHARQLVCWLVERYPSLRSHLVWLEHAQYVGPCMVWNRPVYREDEALFASWAAEQLPLPQAVFGIGSVQAAPCRQWAFNRLTPNLRFLTWLHPKAVVARTSVLGGGSIVAAGAVVQPLVSAGLACLFNTGSVVEHGCQLGANVHIGPNATVCGDVRIGANSFVGAGAVIRQGVTLAEETTVGAGAVVLHDVLEPGCMLVGNPAQIKRPDTART